jgi:hypothetical protein
VRLGVWRTAGAVVAAIGVAGLAASPGHADAPAAGPVVTTCPEVSLLTLDHHDGGQLPDLVCTADGDGTVVLTADGQWSVPLPPFGMQVTSTAQTTSGHTEFIVRHTVDRGVEAVFVDTARDHGEGDPSADHADSDAPQPYQGGAPHRCSDFRWARMGHQVYGPLVWYYNHAGTPANVAATSQDAFTSGFTTVANGRSGCHDEASNLASAEIFAGTTATAPNITAYPTRACTGYDGINVAGWLAGGEGYLGLACVWSWVDPGRGPGAIDADIVLNRHYAWSTGPTFGGSEYDVASVVTHEAGHVFGLGHAGSSAAPSQLTMSGSGVYPASVYARLLGGGDLEGLHTIYSSLPVAR